MIVYFPVIVTKCINAIFYNIIYISQYLALSPFINTERNTKT